MADATIPATHAWTCAACHDDYRWNIRQRLWTWIKPSSDWLPQVSPAHLEQAHLPFLLPSRYAGTLRAAKIRQDHGCV